MTTYPERLRDEEQSTATMLLFLIRGPYMPAIFPLSITVYYLSVTATMYPWLLLLIADPLLRRIWSR